MSGAVGSSGRWVPVSPWRLTPRTLLLPLLLLLCFLPVMTPAQATDLSGVVKAFSTDLRPLPQPCPAHCQCSTRRAHDLTQDHLSRHLRLPVVDAMEPNLEAKLRSAVAIMTSWLGSIADVHCSLPNNTDRLSLNQVLQSSTLSFKSIHVACQSGGSVVWDVSPFYSFLNVLHVSGCALEPAEEGLRIVVPPKLWALELQGVPAEAVTGLDFSQASQLLMLSLTHCSLSTLPRRWSEHVLQSLWFVNLAHNNLSTYGCELKAPQLQALSLDYNNLAALPQCALDGSKYSNHLSLRHNQIHSLQELTISKSEGVAPPVVPQITYLDLAHNQVDSLRALKKMQSLLGLDLSHNHLDIVTSDSFSLHPQLAWLDLSNNFLEHVGDTLLSSLVSLKHLNLSHNYLRSFDFDHDVLSPELMTLDLRHNRLLYPPFADLAFVAPRWVHISASHNPYLCDCNIYAFLQQHSMVKSDEAKFWSSLRSLYSSTARAANAQSYVDIEEFTCAGPLGLKGVPLTSVDFQKVCPLPRGCPKDCRCKLVKEGAPYVSVDCSQATSLTELPEGVPFIADAHVVLFINQTRVRRLDHRPYLHRVRELHAGHSRVSSVTPDALRALENVSVLDLHSAQLRSLPALTQHLALPAVTHLALSGNPWACGCRDLWMPGWMARYNTVVPDADRIRCHWTGKPVTELSPFDLNCGLMDYLPLTIAMSLFIGLLIIVVSFLAKYKLEILVFIHRHSGLRPMDMFKYDRTQPALFDVFVSFSEADYRWVEENLLPRLEKRRYAPPYRLCTLRDFPLGTPVPDSMAWAAENAMCTLLVLTRDMMLNEWRKRPGYRAAHHRLVREVPDKLLVIVHGPLDARSLDPQLLAYLRLGGRAAYLKSEEAWFWAKLEYALPKPQGMVFPTLSPPYLEVETTAGSAATKRGAEERGAGGAPLAETSSPSVVSELMPGGGLAAGDVTSRKAPRVSGYSSCTAELCR